MEEKIIYEHYSKKESNLIGALFSGVVEFVVTNKRIRYRTFFGRRVTLSFNQICGVSTFFWGSLFSVKTFGGKIRMSLFFLGGKRLEVFNLISDAIAESKGMGATADSDADELPAL